MAVLYNARGENPTHAASLKLIKNLAPKLGLQLAEKPIKVVSDVEKTLSSVSRDNTDGLFLICATMFRHLNKNIAAVAMQKKLPLVGCSAQAVSEFGSLLHYGADAYRLGHRGAWYVDRLLKGAKPQDLPVEAPSYFEMIINLKTAKQIWPNDSTERAGKSGQGNQVTIPFGYSFAGSLNSRESLVAILN